MNTRFLETFVWLARLKSFSRTAEKLHASQPAISGRIVALEEMLGVVLYERNVKGFELTPAGRRVLECCERIVDLSHELKSIAAEDGPLGRPVRIGASDAISLSWMPDFLPRLTEAFPAEQFDIFTDAAPNLKRALLNDELDLAFIADGVDEARIANAPLCNYRINWMANPQAFPVADILTIKQLCALPIIMPPPSTPAYRWQIEYLKRHNPDYSPDDPAPVRISSGYSPGTGVQMVALGLGVMAIPPLLAQRWMRSGELAILPVQEEFPPWRMFAAYKTPPTVPMITNIVELSQSVTKDYAERVGGADFWP